MSAQAATVDHAGNEPQRKSGPRFSQAEIEALKARDNVTNLKYLGGVYAVILTTLVLTLWTYARLEASGASVWSYAAVTAFAVAVMGASQHQLGGAVHEATHYILFADRRMSELASDWLAAFPIYTSTYAFRLHHLAHHQFVNDPERDPNFAQAQASGHWLDFPLTHIELLIGILKQLNPVRLVSYIVARVRYSALGVDSNPYADARRVGSRWVMRVLVLVAGGIPLALSPLVANKLWGAAASVLVLGTAAAMLFLLRIPDDAYPQSRIEPVISHRTTALSRVAYLAVLYSALTLAEWYFAVPAWGYFGLLWVLPLFTTFPLFMVLREWLQHGNADRGRYTNSRIFRVNPLVRYAVFPWGMDIHLPHHLNASVPHYKLKDLHQLLLRDPEYAEKCRIVEGWSHRGAGGHPTVVDVLGPDYAPQSAEVHIDDTTLELAEVNDKAGIARHVAASRAAGHDRQH